MPYPDRWFSTDRIKKAAFGDYLSTWQTDLSGNGLLLDNSVKPVKPNCRSTLDRENGGEFSPYLDGVFCCFKGTKPCSPGNKTI